MSIEYSIGKEFHQKICCFNINLIFKFSTWKIFYNAVHELKIYNKENVKILYLTNPKAENLNVLPEFMRKCGDQVEIFYDKINVSFVNF